jgi:hypothetical protein
MLVSPDQSPPLSSEQFLENCRAFLSDPDYQDLSVSSIDPQINAGSGLSALYCRWEASLRNQLVILRARELGLDAQTYLRESADIYGTGPIAAAAVAADSPLEAELYLDSRRWMKIDELSIGHFFDMEFLRAYRLKLQILERHELFEEERGFEAYRNLYARVLSASGADVPMGGNII